MLITEKRLRKFIRKTILEQIKAQLEEGPFMDLSIEHGFEMRQGDKIIGKWSFGEAVKELLEHATKNEDYKFFNMTYVGGRPPEMRNLIKHLNFDINFPMINNKPVKEWDIDMFVDEYDVDPYEVLIKFSKLKRAIPGNNLYTREIADRDVKALEYDPWSED